MFDVTGSRLPRLTVITVIPALSRKTVTSLAHRGTVPHHRLDFFYSNTNNFVQLEDTTIKTERGCSMRCTERWRVLHHSSEGLHCCGCLDQISCTAGLISRIQRVMVGNSGAIWTGAGGLTISRSRRPFRTAYLRFILIEHQYSLHSDRYVRAARTNQCFVLLSEHSMYNDAKSRLADIIYGSQTEQAGCDERQSRLRMKQKCGCDVLEGCSTLFPFFCIMLILLF